MKKVIDWRFRPPFRSYLDGPLYKGYEHGNMSDTIKAMDTAGIAIGVAPFRAGMDNEDCEKLFKEYPDRFKCLIHIDPWEIQNNALMDIDKYVVHGHAAGVIIEPGQIHIRQTIRVDDKILYPLYEKCQEKNILLTITYGGMMNIDPGLYMPQYIAHVCNDFPKLKIVVSHGGWPWPLAMFHVAYNHEFLYISPDAYARPKHAGYRNYIEAGNGILQDKIIFGSAWGFRGSLDDATTMLKSAVKDYEDNFSENVIDKILYHNAAGLLGLEPLTKYHCIG